MNSLRTLLAGSILMGILAQSGLAQLITDFESFTTPTANGTVLFRAPTFSGSTSGRLDPTPNESIVESLGVPAGNPNAGLNTFRATFSFLDTATVPLWVRLTTFGATSLPNPTISLAPGAGLQFDIYSDTAMYVAVLVRETETDAAIGANGGSTGGIEFVGGNSSAASGIRGKTVAANTWTTLNFDFGSELVTAFAGATANGILEPGVDNKGVLEALGLAFDDGTTGNINIWFDNLQVVVIPEPSTVALGLLGGLALTVLVLRQRRK